MNSSDLSLDLVAVKFLDAHNFASIVGSQTCVTVCKMAQISKIVGPGLSIILTNFDKINYFRKTGLCEIGLTFSATCSSIKFLV